MKSFASSFTKAVKKLSRRWMALTLIAGVPLLLYFLFARRGKEGFMSLSNDFSGPDQCLQSGSKDALMAPCEEGPAQQWDMKAAAYIPPKKLINRNPAAGNKCLDLNGGKPSMVDCANKPDQLWWLQANKTIQNVTAGLTKCLDIVNDGAKNKLVMDDCNPDVQGQKWGTGGN